MTFGRGPPAQPTRLPKIRTTGLPSRTDGLELGWDVFRHPTGTHRAGKVLRGLQSDSDHLPGPNWTPKARPGYGACAPCATCRPSPVRWRPAPRGTGHASPGGSAGCINCSMSATPRRAIAGSPPTPVDRRMTLIARSGCARLSPSAEARRPRRREVTTPARLKARSLRRRLRRRPLR